VTRGRFAWLWSAPAVAWAAFLLWLGGLTFDGPFEPDSPIPWDKFAHLALYGMLGALAVLGWRRAGRWPHILVPLGAALAVGIVDELNQRSVAMRSADPLDFLADLIAIVLAFVILRRVREPEGVR
jgi:VanZ family protein